MEPDVTDVDAVDPDAAGGRLDDAEEGESDARLAGARASHDTNPENTCLYSVNYFDWV